MGDVDLKKDLIEHHIGQNVVPLFDKDSSRHSVDVVDREKKKQLIERFNVLQPSLESQCDGNGFISAAYLHFVMTKDEAIMSYLVDELIGRCRWQRSAASTSSPSGVTIKYEDFHRNMMDMRKIMACYDMCEHVNGML